MELDSKNIENLLQRLEKIGIEQKLIPAFMKDLANALFLNPNMNFSQVPNGYTTLDGVTLNWITTPSN